MATELAGTNLELERGGRRILAGVSFRAEAGRALILTGRNGVGKTSLIRACAGLLPLAGGEIALVGGDKERTVGEQAHYVGHLNALKPEMTVRENLAFWAGFLNSGTASDGSAGSPYRSIEDVLERFLLHPLADIPCGYLSAGQKRRSALARVLVASRPVWLLDEPTTALDAHMRDLVISVVDEFLSDGGIVIAATHLALPFANCEELALGSVARPAELETAG